jgi:hypothetical protein
MWAASNPLRLARLRCGYQLTQHPQCPRQHSFSFKALSPSLSLANLGSWTSGTDHQRPPIDGASTPPTEPGTETAVEPPRSIEQAFESVQESVTESLFDEAVELAPTNASHEVEFGNPSAPTLPQVSDTTDPKSQGLTREGEHVATTPRMVKSHVARGIPSTKEVRIYWDQPIRTVWMTYDDQATAEEVKTKFDLGEYTILGHAISTSLSHRLSGGVPVAELALVSLPAGIPKEYIKAAVGKHHLPRTITLGRAHCAADVKLAGASIRSELAKFGVLREWWLQPGLTIWSKNSARATFIDPADARRAAHSLRNRVVAVGRSGPSGAVRLTIFHTHRAGVMIPLAAFEYLRIRIDGLKRKWAPRDVEILASQEKRVYGKLIIVEGEQLRHVKAAQAELVAILEGEVVMDENGSPVWEQVFSIEAVGVRYTRRTDARDGPLKVIEYRMVPRRPLFLREPELCDAWPVIRPLERPQPNYPAAGKTQTPLQTPLQPPHGSQPPQPQPPAGQPQQTQHQRQPQQQAPPQSGRPTVDAAQAEGERVARMIIGDLIESPAYQFLSSHASNGQPLTQVGADEMVDGDAEPDRSMRDQWKGADDIVDGDAEPDWFMKDQRNGADEMVDGDAEPDRFMKDQRRGADEMDDWDAEPDRLMKKKRKGKNERKGKNQRRGADEMGTGGAEPDEFLEKLMGMRHTGEGSRSSGANF